MSPTSMSPVFHIWKPKKCILRLEKNKFDPPVPCFSPEINQYPEVSEDHPNCYIGGWAWTNTHFTSGWSLLTEHVQQVDYKSCENGLGTPIKESELCVVGTSSNLAECNIFYSKIDWNKVDGQNESKWTVFKMVEFLNAGPFTIVDRLLWPMISKITAKIVFSL